MQITTVPPNKCPFGYAESEVAITPIAPIVVTELGVNPMRSMTRAVGEIMRTTAGLKMSLIIVTHRRL
jgi:hypothetical protein